MRTGCDACASQPEAGVPGAVLEARGEKMHSSRLRKQVLKNSRDCVWRGRKLNETWRSR